MAYAPFDVVVVPFPTAGRLAEKRRPAIVISAPDLEKRHGLVWLAMVTSASDPAWRDDVLVSDLKSAGLPAPSRIRPAKIATSMPRASCAGSGSSARRMRRRFATGCAH